MATNIATLEAKVMKLGIEDRARLAEKLVLSLDAPPKKRTCASGSRRPSGGCGNCARARPKRHRPGTSSGARGPRSHEASDLP
jgi:hypothetical protein